MFVSKKIFIIGNIILLIFIIAFLFFLLSPKKQGGATDPVAEPKNKVFSIDDNRLSFQTPSGRIVTKDFLNQANDITVNGDKQLVDSGDFKILYLKNTSMFLISLKSKPLRQSRLLAEEQLIHLLGIDRNDLCSLNTSVITSKDVDYHYAGMEFGISSCKGSINLP